MFKVAGVSVRDNQMKVRWASDMTRIKVLVKTGHTDINLVELPETMDKGQAVTYLKTTELYSNPQYREAIDAADAKYNGDSPVKAVRSSKDTASKKSSTVKTKATKVAPSLDAIRARTTVATTETAQEDSSKKPAVQETV